MSKTPRHRSAPQPSAIRAAREQAGMSQSAAAMTLRVAEGQWGRWETGIQHMPAVMLEHFQLLTDTHPTLVLRRREQEAAARCVPGVASG